MIPYRMIIQHGICILAPIGDTHFGAGNKMDIESFKKFCNRARREKWILLTLGDLLDFTYGANRKVLRSMIDISEDMDDYAEDLCRKFAAMLKGCKIGAMIDGHHYLTLSSGLTTTQRICQILNLPPDTYLGKHQGLFIVKQFNGTHCHTRWIHMLHGKGAPRGVGTSIDSLEKQADGINADVVVGGHSCQFGESIQRWIDKGLRGEPIYKSKVVCKIPAWTEKWKDPYAVAGYFKPAPMGIKLIKLGMAEGKFPISTYSEAI